MKQNQIICGDALDILKTFPDECINCCVTSPPYFGLRDYGVKGQIGLEETVEDYILRLLEVFREVHRVLKSDGTLWINIGDSYAGSGKGRNSDGTVPDSIYHCKEQFVKGRITGMLFKALTSEMKPKDLMGIPWLLALMLRSDGWYLRQDIIWQKPNVMPEAVRDRCTKSHEYIFLLSKSRRYYFDYERIKEPCVGFDKTSPRGSKGTLTPNSGRRKGNAKTFRGGGVYTNNKSFMNSYPAERNSHGNKENPTGLRNKRSIWTVATQGLKGLGETHFATFPEKLIEPCILAGCPEGGTVLDPFAGSGTTGIVAIKNNRYYIMIDLNEHYCELQRTRILEEEPDIYSIKS